MVAMVLTKNHHAGKSSVKSALEGYCNKTSCTNFQYINIEVYYQLIYKQSNHLKPLQSTLNFI